MELYHLCVTIIFALSHFDVLQFGIARWSPSAISGNSIEHENDNISIKFYHQMDFDKIVAKYPGERYQAHLGLLLHKEFSCKQKRISEL